MQFSDVGGSFAPQVLPLSKLYCIPNPAIVVGGVTRIGPQSFTTGAGGAGGKTITLTTLLAPQVPSPVDPAGVSPQAAASTYRALTEWQP